jgi:hypothetical protein
VVTRWGQKVITYKQCLVVSRMMLRSHGSCCWTKVGALPVSSPISATDRMARGKRDSGVDTGTPREGVVGGDAGTPREGVVGGDTGTPREVVVGGEGGR